MAFVKKVWKDRIAEYINRRLLTNEDGTQELVTVARNEGNISQEGDAFNAANMNDLEDRIANEFQVLNEGKQDVMSSPLYARDYNVADWNILGGNGWYCGNNASNAPETGWINALVLCSDNNQNYKTVIAIAQNSGNLYTRVYFENSMSGWHKI